MKTSDVLKAAKAKIEQGWTKGALARDAIGISTHPDSRIAVCWCSTGAIAAVTKDLDVFSRCRLFLQFATRVTITQYNDTHTKEEVLAKFDEAIALAEKEETQ